MALYWQASVALILDRQEREKWGAKVIDRLATGSWKRSFLDMERILTSQPEVHARLRGSVAER